MSAITGSFVWRMGIDVLFFFITTVFMVALLRIKRMITRMNSFERLKPNYTLMNINLVTFAFEWIVYMNVFTVAT